MRIQKTPILIVMLLSCALVALAQSKPKLTLDEFFNSVGVTGLEISPDGSSVAFAAERADWDQQIFRSDLWLYRDATKSLIQLTQSGHDSEPKWSPDARWIAFVSERANPNAKSGDSDSDADSGDAKKKSKDADAETTQIYLISPTGGEAFPITQGDEDVHAFSWSPDSKTIYFATRQPQTAEQKDDYKKAVERRCAVPHRRTRRHHLRPRCSRRSRPPRRRPRQSRCQDREREKRDRRSDSRHASHRHHPVARGSS